MNFFSRHSRTPASSGKKFLLSTFFSTPSRTRVEEGNGGDRTLETPSRVSKLQLSATPSFLRRNYQRLSTHASSSLETTISETSPVAVRMPYKLMGKGLSSLVKGLREMEDEKLDDEMDIMREMEAQGDDDVFQTRESQGGGKANEVHDYGNKDDDDDDDDQGTESGSDNDKVKEPPTTAPRKAWKKKGQKRTTRRVIMRPVRTKPVSQPKSLPIVNDEEEDHEDLINDNNNNNDKEPKEPTALPENDHGDLDPQPNPEKSQSTNMNTKNPPSKQTTTKAPSQAHVNYRALKIRGKGQVGKRKGRFGKSGRR